MTQPPGPAGERKDPPLFNVPNMLTVLRIVLVPIFVIFVVASGMTDPGLRVAAFITFAAASVTDLADGWIARRFGLVTPFGKVADPIADKALTGTALILLSVYGHLPWWVTIVILIREIGITLLRFWVIRSQLIAASRGGKIKTALQTLAIGWYLLPFPPGLAEVGPWLMGAAVIATVVTGIDYVVTALRSRHPVASGHASG
jgi:CDP-diacylglycerol--glycerol-3-phosphate 3-phosphatidyltransferase